MGARIEADALERREHRLAQSRFPASVAPEAERVACVRLHRQRHVVEQCEIEKQRCDLKRARQAEQAAAVRRRSAVTSRPTSGLLLLLAWLTEMGCTHVATKATRIYWKPVWNILI